MAFPARRGHRIDHWPRICSTFAPQILIRSAAIPPNPIRSIWPSALRASHLVIGRTATPPRDQARDHLEEAVPSEFVAPINTPNSLPRRQITRWPMIVSGTAFREVRFMETSLFASPEPPGSGRPRERQQQYTLYIGQCKLFYLKFLNKFSGES